MITAVQERHYANESHLAAWTGMRRIRERERGCESRRCSSKPGTTHYRQAPLELSALSAEESAEFRVLTSKWRHETAIHGNLSKIVMHPAYQRIMAMGKGVIPLILQELSNKGGHWFWALHHLVPEGTDPAEGISGIEEATRAWLDWGEAKGIL